MVNIKESHHRYYMKRIAEGICTMCGGEACYGFTMCSDCQEKKAEYYEQHREAILKQEKEKRERYIAEGRCTKCGKPKEDNGVLNCNACRERQKLYTKRYRALYSRRKCTDYELRELHSKLGKRNIKICNAKNAERIRLTGSRKKEVAKNG